MRFKTVKGGGILKVMKKVLKLNRYSGVKRLGLRKIEKVMT